MIIRTLTTVATVAAALASASAIAAPTETKSRAVDYADLNLATPAGVATLHHRIAAAISAVCGGFEGGLTLEETMDIEKCRTNARAQADQRVALLLSTKIQTASAR